MNLLHCALPIDLWPQLLPPDLLAHPIFAGAARRVPSELSLETRALKPAPNCADVSVAVEHLIL